MQTTVAKVVVLFYSKRLYTYCRRRGNLLALLQEVVSACCGRGRGLRGLRDDRARRGSSASSKPSV